MATDAVSFDQSTYGSYAPVLSMPTMATDAVSLDLLRSSLDELKSRFRAAGDPVSPSKAWLVCEHGNRDGRPPIGGLIDGYNSPSVESSPSTWSSACAIGALGAQFRLRGYQSLTPICTDAASMLMGLPAAVQKRLWRGLPSGAAPERANQLALWMLAVFELANSNVVGSPLRAVRQIPLAKETDKAFFAPESKLPADSDWYATLPDFAAASVQAIDILQSWLADELKRETEATNEPPKSVEQPGTKRTYYAPDVEHQPERHVCDLFPCAKDAFAGTRAKGLTPGEIAVRKISGPGVNVTRRTYCPTDDEMTTLQRAGGWLGAIARLTATGQTVLAIEQMDAPEILRRLAAETAEGAGQGGKPVERQAETLASGDEVSDGQLQLKPCEGKAWWQFQEAVGKNSELTTDRQAYDWFVDEIADDAGELPSFANWSRYLRAARKAMNQGKNGPRIGNETRSVVSVERIEQPRKRIEADR